MPLLEGNLSDIAKIKYGEHGIKDEVLLASIMYQVVEGLAYLHSHNQIHRDLKAQNILIHENGQIIISDFGVSDYIKPGDKKFEFVGSPCWMAPEVILQQSGYGVKADIWALGITVLELASGRVPHYDENARITLKKILEGEPPELSRYYDWSTDIRKFVEDCLVKDSALRISSD